MFDFEEGRQELAEDVIRDALPMPLLSHDLRDRVLLAAVKADQRRSILRRVTNFAVCFLGLVAWVGMGWAVTSGRASADHLATAHPSSSHWNDGEIPLNGPVSLMKMADVGDWGHVEAVTTFKRIQLRALREFSSVY